MSQRPRTRVAMLMATYNDAETLAEALDSLRRQTTAVDIFMVDDCSSPSPLPNTIAGLNVISLSRNMGLTKALNIGLAQILAAGYEFVGRMDADDISANDRIQKQLDCLDANPQLSGVGSWAAFFDGRSGADLFVHRGPTSTEGVANALRSNSCVLHPTWLFRSEVFKAVNGYDESYPVAQDYDLLVRAVAMGFSFTNVPEVLLKYRVSGHAISIAKRRQQLLARLRVQAAHFSPRKLTSWAGIAKTIVLLVVPRLLLTKIKVMRSRTADDLE